MKLVCFEKVFLCCSLLIFVLQIPAVSNISYFLYTTQSTCHPFSLDSQKFTGISERTIRSLAVSDVYFMLLCYERASKIYDVISVAAIYTKFPRFLFVVELSAFLFEVLDIHLPSRRSLFTPGCKLFFLLRQPNPLLFQNFNLSFRHSNENCFEI